MDVYSASGMMILAIQDNPAGVIGGGGDQSSVPLGPGTEVAPGGTGGPGGGGATPASNPFGSMWPILLAFVVFMLLTTMMSGRREKRERKTLMSSLGKHDKVQLSGGMIGTITEIKPDEVVVRVDESNKTTIRFMKSAVVRVLKSGGHGSSDVGSDESEIVDEITEPASV